MAGAKDTNARVTRCFLALQDFRFKVDVTATLRCLLSREGGPNTACISGWDCCKNPCGA